MKLIGNLFHALAISAMAVIAAPAMAETDDSGMDILYAEHAPLTTHSLMLDALWSGRRLIAAGERGHIILSDDNGESWRQAETVPTRSTLTALSAFEGRLWAAGHDSVILTSADRGENWTRQYFDPDRLQPIMDLLFLDQDHGIAVGAYGLMLVTADGGRNWEDQVVNEEYDAHLNAILRMPDGTLLIAGEAGYSYRSSDSGETWEPMAVPYAGSMFGAVLANESCVLFYGLRGHVMRSCDAGHSWKELNTGSEATLLGAAQEDGKVVLAGNGGTILQYNGDNGFSQQLHSSGVDFSSVLALGEGRFLLTGEEGTYFYPEKHSGGVE